MRSKNNDQERWFEKLAASLADDSFVQLTLSGPRIGPPSQPERILARLILLQGSRQLSFTSRYPTRDAVQNMPVPAGLEAIHGWVGCDFRTALLCTTEWDWQLYVAPSGSVKLARHKPSIATAPARSHDRVKPSFLNESASDWLCGLGITDLKGIVHPSRAGKYRQIHRYLEVLSHLAQEAGWSVEAEKGGAGPLVIADMGCGRGYLTFAVWHFFRRVWGWPVRVIGVDVRPELVAGANRLVGEIAAAGLEFAGGTIETALLPKLDVLIALHACNTATDDAIRRGIELESQLILLAPCCHQQLRPMLKRPDVLSAMLRHGVMEERLAEWLTDGLRALYLERAGYKTKLFEFVPSEHTPKNLMIAAVRNPGGRDVAAIGEQIAKIKNFFGLEQHPLDDLVAAGAERHD